MASRTCRTHDFDSFSSTNQPPCTPLLNHVYSCKVCRIESYGAYLSFQDINYQQLGLCHILRMSFSRLGSVEEVMKIGEIHRCMVVDIRVDSSSGRSRLKLNLAKCVGGAGDTGDEIFGSGVEVQDLVLDWDKELQQKLHALQKQQKHGLHDQQLHRVQQQHPNSDRWTGVSEADAARDARRFSGLISNLKKNQDVPGLLDLYAQNSQRVNAIHLANIYGAFARSVRGSVDIAKLQSDDRFKMLHGNLLDKLRNTPEWFDVRQMATITHSLGKMTIADHDFFTEIVKLRARIAKEGNPQHLSNIVWSFAKLEYKSQDLFAAVAGEHKRIARDGKVQEVSNIAWALAKMKYKCDEFYEAVAGEHERIAKEGNSQDLSNTCWALATAGHKAEDLFRKVAIERLKITGGGDLQHMSNIVWAFATSGAADGAEAEELFKAVAGQNKRIVADGSSQHLTNTLWSFTVAGKLDLGKELIEKLWSRACGGEGTSSNDGVQQLAFFYAAAQIEGRELNLEAPPKFLLDQIESVVSEVADSRAQNLVSRTLNEMKIDHIMEVSPFKHGGNKTTFNTGDMLNIDIVIPINGYCGNAKKIALEFNGPSHYVKCNGQDVESGLTKFKRRLAGKLGFSYKSIHWNEWRLAFDANKQTDLIGKLFKE